MESNGTPLIVQSQKEVLMVLDPAESLDIIQEGEAGRPHLWHGQRTRLKIQFPNQTLYSVEEDSAEIDQN